MFKPFRCAHIASPLVDYPGCLDLPAYTPCFSRLVVAEQERYVHVRMVKLDPDVLVLTRQDMSLKDLSNLTSFSLINDHAISVIHFFVLFCDS